MNKKRPYLVGISGGSASGKTLFLRKVMGNFGENEITLVSQDNYYFPREKQVVDDEGLINFDHPKSVDLDAFSRDVDRLCKGERVELMEYNFNNANKEPKAIVYEPSPVIIVEGLFVFYEERIGRAIDLKIFVEADEHLKLIRRIIRDYEERGYGLDDVLGRYEHHVMPMYKKFVLPYKDECDLMIPNNNHIDVAAKVLSDHIRTFL